MQTDLQAIMRGDSKAFEQLISAYQKLVFQIVNRMIRREQDREDLVQEVFLRIYKGLPAFKGDARLSTWIARITFNTCANHLEKKKASLYDDFSNDREGGFEVPSTDEPGSDPIQHTIHADLNAVLERELQKLPPLLATLVTLFHIQGRRYREICKIVNLPEGTVKSYLFRARRLLRERLDAAYYREELLG